MENCNDWVDGCKGKLKIYSSTDGEYFQVCDKCDSTYELGGCLREWVWNESN